jgi:hypothetical protein
MCWNAPVSIGFGLIHLLAFKLTTRQSYRLFTGFYAIMEFYQAFQWLFGDVGNCTPYNALITTIAYCLIWFQPWLYILIGEAEDVGLRYGRKVALITFFWSLFTLSLGLLKQPTYYLPDSNFGYPTCTKVGSHGHLHWIFSPITMIYQPSYYSYVVLIATTMSFYPRQLYPIIQGWTLTLLLSLLYVGTGPELPAIWCWLSVLVSLRLIVLRN